MPPSTRFHPRRSLGRTGFVVTALGQGDVADRSIPEARCVSIVRRAVTLLGLSFENEQDAAFTAAVEASPLSAEELQDLRARAVEAARGKGRVWWDPTGATESRE